MVTCLWNMFIIYPVVGVSAHIFPFFLLTLSPQVWGLWCGSPVCLGGGHPCVFGVGGRYVEVFVLEVQ